MKSDILNFESFINHSPLIIFIWNPIPNEPVLYVSENISQFGYSQEEFLTHRIVYSDIVHPDDLHKIRSESQQHMRDNTKSFLFSPLGNTNITMVIFDDNYGTFINN